jgi:hypothetical protein
MDGTENNLTTALNLAAAGLPIFPAGPDKRPLLVGWQDKASTNAEQLRKWWRVHPNALPALVVGKAGLIVIDCDRHPGGADGVAALKALVNVKGRMLPNPPMTRTVRGGVHLFFKQPNGEPFGNSRGDLPDGVDVRGAGGFVIAPGSMLPNGKRWVPINGKPLLPAAYRNGSIPELPQWLADIIRAKRQSNGGDVFENTARTYTKALRSGEQAYAAAALDGVVAELSAAPNGKRNETLNAVAFRMGKMIARGWVDEKAVTDALLGASDANSYLREHGRYATMKTIQSGMEAGKREPHPDLPDRGLCCSSATDLSGLSGLSDVMAANRQSASVEQKSRSRNIDTGSWDEPDWGLFDDRRGELTDFPVEVLPASIHDWLPRAARGAGVTPGHVVVPLLGIASSLIGTARRVRASRSWSEPLAMWVALVGFSGTGKTPGLDATRRVISLIERGRMQKIAEMQREHETRAQKAKAERKKWEQAVAEAVEANLPVPPKPPSATEPDPFVAPRLCVSDSTIERLAVLLQVRPQGMAFVADELARLFLNMKRYSRGQDNEFWLEAWNGKNFLVERQGARRLFWIICW